MSFFQVLLAGQQSTIDSMAHILTHSLPRILSCTLHLAQNIILFSLFLNPLSSVPVSITILTDDKVEVTEDFRLALLSHADNPTTNIRLAGNMDTQVVILNENGI